MTVRRPLVAGGLALLALALTVPAMGAVAQGSAPKPTDAVVALSPASSDVGTQPVTITLVVTGAPETVGFQADLLYDDAVVVVTRVELGSWIAGGGRVVQTLGPNMDTPGRVVLGALTAGEAAPASGDGVLARFVLAPHAAGTSDLKLTNVTLLGTGQDTFNPEALGGAVRIAEAPDPTTAAAALDRAATVAAVPVATMAEEFAAAVNQEATREAPTRVAAEATAVVTGTATGEAVAMITAAARGPAPVSAGSRSWLLPALLVVTILALGWLLLRGRGDHGQGGPDAHGGSAHPDLDGGGGTAPGGAPNGGSAPG
jgi:hypothetical protein